MPGSFAPNAGGRDPLDDIICGVTVRFAHLDAVRGPGCDLEVRGWEIEAMWAALPSLRADALAFLNRDFDTRFDAPFREWGMICNQAAGIPCVNYPTPTRAQGTLANGTPWSIDPFLQGCGSTEFPPNARWRGDITMNNTMVQSRCEHFGLRDGPDGTTTPTSSTAPPRSPRWSRCSPTAAAAGRSTGDRASGIRHPAHNADGTPMKNWWPLLFY